MNKLTEEQKKEIALELLDSEQLEEYARICEEEENPDIGGVKLDRFNDCPGADEIFEAIKDLKVKVEDSKHKGEDAKYWKNCGDTLVVSMDISDAITAVNIAALAVRHGADEFHSRVAGGKIWIRLWWD